MGAFRRNMQTSFLDDTTNLTCINHYYYDPSNTVCTSLDACVIGPTRGLNLGQTGLTMFYDPSTFGYDMCRCPSEPRHFWNTALSRCLPCPMGCSCDATAVADATRAIVIRRDWYPLCDGAVCKTVNRDPMPTMIECYVPGLCKLAPRSINQSQWLNHVTCNHQ